jgi:hypothetical protein
MKPQFPVRTLIRRGNRRALLLFTMITSLLEAEGLLKKTSRRMNL